MDSEFLGRLYALDTWMEVLDRRKPEGVWNLLNDTATGAIIVIDFGKALAPALSVLPVLEPDKIVQPSYSPAVILAADVESALDTCDTIEKIPAQEIEEIVGSVPAHWLDDESRTAIVEFLMDRRKVLRAACNGMQGGGA
jgi:hypothetical protein